MEKRQQAKISLTAISITIKIKTFFLLLLKISINLIFPIKVIIMVIRQNDRVLKHNNLLSQKAIRKMSIKE